MKSKVMSCVSYIPYGMLIIFASELRARVPHLRGQQAEAVLPGEAVKHCKPDESPFQGGFSPAAIERM